MPATVSYCQSIGTPWTYRLRGSGQEVEIRNGCVVHAATRRTLTTSDETASWLLKNARLTDEQRFEIETKLKFVWPNAGSPLASKSDYRNRYMMQTRKEREAAE